MEIKKLLKSYSFTDAREYFDMIVGSITNGQVGQAKEQFIQLPKEERVQFLRKLAKDIHMEDPSPAINVLHDTLMICLNQIY